MISLLSTLLLVAACLGAGSAVSRALALHRHLARREHLPFAFALGFGVVGWLVFLPAAVQMLSPSAILVILCTCLPGLALLPWRRPRLEGEWTWVSWLLLAAGLGIAVLNLLQAVAPPADADSLAYHFALPKEFLRHGGLVFQPIAVERAIPLLAQMTYSAAYALGGERAMTLWTMVSGWGAGWLLWAVCRRHVGPSWALATALAWQTVPAVVYGVGSGQIEVRTAMMVLAAAVLAVEAVRSGNARLAVAAGLAAGFFVASKYTGLVAAAGCGAIFLTGRRPIRLGVLYGLAVMLAGGQFYVWNWSHTGDPLFPMLYGLLPYHHGVEWSAEAGRLMKLVFGSNEVVLPRSPLWAVWYPFAATFDPVPSIESGRTGLGVLPVLLAPFAAASTWQWRHRLRHGRLARIALVAAIIYGLWHFTGPSQRVRHLLPLLPLLLLSLTVAAAHLQASPTIRRAVVFAMAATLLLQGLGLGVFSLKYLRFAASGESREHFLDSQVPMTALARWLNQNLSAGDKVMLQERGILYFLDVDYLYGHWFYQDMVSLGDGRDDPQALWTQLRRQSVTHIATSLAQPVPPAFASEKTPWMVLRLVEAGCARQITQLPILTLASRTLPELGQSLQTITVLQLLPGQCPYKAP